MMAITLKLTGRLADIMSQPLQEITRVVVKAPAYRPGPGVELTTSQPQTVDLGADGAMTINVVEGVGWIYVEGPGWSDSIRFVAAAGMTTIWEAVVNALPIVVEAKRLLTELGKQYEAQRADLLNLAKNQTEKFLQVVSDATQDFKNDVAHVDEVAAAIDAAFADSVPPYLQPNSPTGLGANYRTAIVARRDPDTNMVTWEELQACADRAAAEGRPLFAEGICETNRVLHLECDAYLSGLTIKWNGPGPNPEDAAAVRVGNLETSIARKQIHFPHIIGVGQNTKNADGTYTWNNPNTFGIDIQHSWSCDFYVSEVRDFYTGVRLYSQLGAHPTAYNNFFLNTVWGCYMGLYIFANRGTGYSGWVNENVFFGGRICTYYGGKAHVVISGNTDPAILGSGRPNMNVFYGTCLEGAAPLNAVEIVRGEQNHFHNCRFETVKSCLLGAETVGNTFRGGYGLATVTFNDSGVLNMVESSNAVKTQQEFFYRGSSHTFDSIKIRPSQSAIYLGPGSAEASAFIKAIGTSSIQLGGSGIQPQYTFPAQSGETASDLGSEAKVFRNAFVGNYLKLGPLYLSATSGQLKVGNSPTGPWQTVTLS